MYNIIYYRKYIMHIITLKLSIDSNNTYSNLVLIAIG